ncbi:DUF5655 domain-containing protein [Mucilaginibacter phyllosphaerae]|uniref:DUF5655 domain-containing protein n=1 Tax=Mucilaginibacter phyllosphaerae TaxID=1812349 RepID=A0A4Y8A984_9SPHI|nr:DUF5655 domain-containing protein [Mucilaginibacter phyllosphaerae]MBB3969611.1 hypothetical protein [Mucilaginibacter phyllosphaerae]TEW64998.1 hypothetical protein E2R65_13840 [Mucilaginibacter phyllosphaerae]GGH18611.1 hypothetical protein GCM10007352_29460 [Mucilaginibacter phyllosphaerae]
MPYTCPKCDRELTGQHQRHYCARVNPDDLFKGKPDELILLFDKLLAEVAGWPDVLVGVTPNCITFVHRQTFFVIRPMQKQLDLKFYSATKLDEPPVIKSTQATAKRFENHIRLSSTNDLRPQLFTWIRESYGLL